MNAIPIAPEKPSAILAVVKSPMVFNAFSILVVAFLAWRTADIEPTPPVVWFGLVFIAAVTVWLNVFAAINPRFLAYGPTEYLEESRLAHEQEMARFRQS
jgi:hypothetical protein